MAFRAPQLNGVHAMRQVGIANMQLGIGAEDTDFPLDNILDDRSATLFKLSASGALEVEVDLGFTFAADGLRNLMRLIIPTGHNIAGNTITIKEDDNFDFTSATLVGTDTGDAGLIDIPLTINDATGTLERYIQVRIGTSVTYEIPQMVLTKPETFTRGPDLAGSTDEKAYNFTRLQYPSGISPTVQHGSPQRVIEYEYRDLAGADLTAMEAFIDSVDMSKSFWVDPASFSTPPETDEPVLWMKFAEPPRISNEIIVPQSGARSKHFRLSLIESLD